MSSYSNANFAPPPPIYPPNATATTTTTSTTTKGGGSEGVIMATMAEEANDQAVNGQFSHFPPSQHQHNQLRNQQQQYQQMEYQQQQILQQKLNQQQPQPITPMPGHMNQYMPPPSTATNSQAPFNKSFQQAPPMNGPTTTTTVTATAGPTTTMLPPVNNLPPHMRPPPMHNNVGLTNGGDHGSSATSSRTNSPGLQQITGSMQNMHLQQQQRPHNGALPPPSQQQQAYMSNIKPPQQQPPPPSLSTTMPPTIVPQQPHQQQQQLARNMNYAPPPLTATAPVIGRPPPPPTTTNGNNANVHQNGQPSITPTTINGTQRRPMYPMQAPPTLQPPQQQQQPMSQVPPPQQPYAGVYHQSFPNQQPQQQQQQRMPGTFNGQATASPLQYQSQQQMPPQPPPPLSGSTATTSPYMARPPQSQQPQQPQQPQQQQQGGGLLQQGFSRLWGQDTIDLMQNRHIMATTTMEPPKIILHNQFHESINCNPNIMRCTVAKIPESNALLQKSRLPLGILIHPFRDINSLPVIQCPSIVRCRLCRTYINPFVYFVDSKMWKCNLCYRVNELPEDFQYDPATKTYGDVTRRPEVRSSTIEFIAPSEYMLRPPQPAIYLFLFDVSIIAQQCGYLESLCTVLSQHLDDMPGDARTRVGFIAYNSQVHFYSMADGYSQPHEMTLVDIDDAFLPRPDNLLVNLKECKELIKDLLVQLPTRFADSHDHGSAMGAALQVAYKLMQASGGRVTVFQTCLPNKGPGALEAREDPNNRSAKDVAHLNPATDFYKRYALECSGNQIAVDLFLLNQQYSDMATISGISKHSGGCVHHFPLYQKTKSHHVDAFRNCFKRYLVRKIGFEAVMRIRCTRGLQVHTFHGNFFVRSTDLLSLPNVNPDAGYGMQISYEESLTDVKTICFQAALLYTNSEGERRIRVHTLCLPVTASLPEVMHAADTEAIIGLLAKMAVDRSIGSNISDARDAFINATVDIFNAFKIAQNLPSGQTGQLIAPRSLALMPLYILALLKHPAFRVGTSTRLDDRVYAMDCMKTLPLDQLMKFIYPEFYNIDVLFYKAQTASNNVSNNAEEDDEEEDLPDIRRLQLSAEHLDSRAIFLMDCGNLIMLYVGLNVPPTILNNLFGIKSTAELGDYVYGLPQVNSAENSIVRRFIDSLNDDKPYPPIVQIIRDTSTAKSQFIEKLVDDRSESSLSVYEFLQHIRSQVK